VLEPSQHIDRIGPARGIVLAHTRRGKALPSADIERWIRLARTVFHCDKIDVLAHGGDISALLQLKPVIAPLGVALSLRSNCESPPPAASTLRQAGLLDVFLSPDTVNTSNLFHWLDACREAELPVRVQLNAPFSGAEITSEIVSRLSHASVVNVSASDPFCDSVPARNDVHAKDSLESAVTLARTLLAKSIEVNLIGIPFCAVPKDLWANVCNSPQFFLDHQQYKRESFELAAALYRRSPMWVRQIILIKLGQYTSTNNPIDRILLPWIMDHPWARARVWAFHKIARQRRSAVPASPASAQLEVERYETAKRTALGKVCAACSLRRICDGPSPRLPGLTLVSQSGEDAIDPLLYARAQTKHYDAVDAGRRDAATFDIDLARRANDIVINTPPAREIDSFDYKVDGTWSWQLPGSLRWFSFAGGEKVSTPLGRLDPPFTLSVTFGGGVAEYIGFAIGRACRLLVPMTAYTHRVVLHVEPDGRYVLLRDGQPLRPQEFVGAYYVPAKLGNGLEPRIAAWNIDGTLGTQAVYLWQPSSECAPSRAFKVSVVLVCTRYSRRLQACLQNLVHQKGVGIGDIEIIVAFVPGLDATNDILDGMQLLHPDLTIVPAPFAPEYANTKGLMLNECLDKARGEWVMVLDSDILLAPDMLEKLVALPPATKFAIPDGRKMLSRETTARILFGEVKPWETWDALLSGAGEYRMREADGVPVGYCQCVRRECLSTVRYEELHHFEGADWKFGKDMRDNFGMEHRLSGTPVLHLDHGSSNWYGASRQY